ncbi:hypothetical protein PCAR4_570140 [Paraburkholderia caribensis]|nr:hypothetical protein PCAR4_570140 [Paraburkholderia caribensis]
MMKPTPEFGVDMVFNDQLATYVAGVLTEVAPCAACEPVSRTLQGTVAPGATAIYC